jgi:bifunctional DNA-binding transcriptional regulator/antitoxin component of YhaV-PrlF toxin-antitoxin module
METLVTEEGQTDIPIDIRVRHHLREGDRLLWLDDGVTIHIVPAPADPIKALRGIGRGEGLLEVLLRRRREDREIGS